MPALVGPASGRISTSLKPASLHHAAKSAPVKSNASPNSISMLSDMRRPNAFSRRASSVIFLLDDDVGAALRQRVVGRLDQLLLPIEVQSWRIIPIVMTSASGR